MTKIHRLTATPMGILIVYRDRLWEFRVLANASTYGEAKHYSLLKRLKRRVGSG